jgi:hypothetical protein
MLKGDTRTTAPPVKSDRRNDADDLIVPSTPETPETPDTGRDNPEIGGF